MDVLLVNGVLYNFLGAEGDISGWIEVSRSFMDSSFAGSPSINFGNLSERDNYSGVFLAFIDLDNSTERRDNIDVNASVWAVGVLERHQSDL